MWLQQVVTPLSLPTGEAQLRDALPWAVERTQPDNAPQVQNSGPAWGAHPTVATAGGHVAATSVSLP